MIAQFALRLIVGMSLMWALMPRKDVTSGFFRIQMLITLALGVLAGLTLGQFNGGEITDPPTYVQMLCYGVAGVSFLGSVLWTLERRFGGSVLCFAILVMSTIALIGNAMSADDGWWFLEAAIVPAGELASAAMVGGFLTTMLLGHWYLTAPTMTIRPLFRLTLYLSVCTAARCAVSVAAYLANGKPIAGLTEWMWLSLRWGAGIVGPAVLVVMVVRILDHRNTQSATGVLFVGVILTFIGELSGSLLARIHVVPL